MRDYTRLPGYEEMTNLDARHNYLHELLERWCGGGRACMSCSTHEVLPVAVREQAGRGDPPAGG